MSLFATVLLAAASMGQAPAPVPTPSSPTPLKEVVGETLAAAGTDPVRDLDDLVDADRAARELAEGALTAA